MASAKTELYLSKSRMVRLSTAVFIMLSVWSAAEGRRCYWCGPLAEQVHRSRRAPPCDAPQDHRTTCEPPHTHCAVVATSPPYVESRLCVKLYQDECYPLFCNSTKTWKMTCPCRGDLCNGFTTEREEEAFAYLAKLVKKTSRMKRHSIAPSKLVPDDEESPTYIDNNSEETVQSTNEAVPAINNNIIENYDVSTESSNQTRPVHTHAMDGQTDKDEMELSEIVSIEATIQDSAQDSDDDNVESRDMEMQADAPNDINHESFIPSSVSSSSPVIDTKLISTGLPSGETNTREISNNDHTTIATELEAMIEQSTELSIHPSGGSPAAEAHSQSIGATEKTDDIDSKKIDTNENMDKSPQEKVAPTEKTSTAPNTKLDTSSTVGYVEITTQPGKSKAETIYLHKFNYISWVTLYFFL